MPLYDYKCKDCGDEFELLILKTSGEPTCPKCQSRNLDQLISTFAVDSQGTRKLNLNAARRQNSKVQRDKAIAEHEQIHNSHD